MLNSFCKWATGTPTSFRKEWNVLVESVCVSESKEDIRILYSRLMYIAYAYVLCMYACFLLLMPFT